MSTSFHVTEGQNFGINSVPKGPTANQKPNCYEVLYFCPRLLGGCKLRQTNGRRPHVWRDMNHAVWTERQTTPLMTIVAKGHDHVLFCRLACVRDGRPMSAEPQHDPWSILWCPDERCGIRLLVREGEQSETKIVSFGQSTERLSTVNETTKGDYDGISTIWNGPPRHGRITRDKPLPHRDQRPNIRDWRWDGVDRSMVNESFNGYSPQFNQPLIPVNICYKGRRREGERDPTEVIAGLIEYFCCDRWRVFRGSNVRFGSK